MALFPDLGITNAGRQLLAKSIAGSTIRFTKIQLGDGNLPDNDPGTGSRTALVSSKITLEITKLTVVEAIATVYAKYNNTSISSGFTWRELGVFATDPDVGEILYTYGNAGSQGDYIPPGGAGIVERQVAVRNLVENASSVTANISESLLYVTTEEMNAAINLVPYYTAVFSKSGSNWVFTNANIPFTQKEFAIQANVTSNSVDNQKIKVNNLELLPLKIGTQNVMQNDVDVNGASTEVTIKVNRNTGIAAGFLENGGGGGGGLVQSMTAPTSAADKKKQWFCTDPNSAKYHTMNIWDGTAWVSVVGTFSA